MNSLFCPELYPTFPAHQTKIVSLQSYSAYKVQNSVWDILKLKIFIVCLKFKCNYSSCISSATSGNLIVSCNNFNSINGILRLVLNV